jgi:hypothetical protein
VERLLVSSAPFQELIMTTRRIYRWENRNETLKYLVGYSTLWVLNLVLPGFVSHSFLFNGFYTDLKAREHDISDSAPESPPSEY